MSSIFFSKIFGFQIAQCFFRWWLVWSGLSLYHCWSCNKFSKITFDGRGSFVGCLSQLYHCHRPKRTYCEGHLYLLCTVVEFQKVSSSLWRSCHQNHNICSPFFSIVFFYRKFLLHIQDEIVKCVICNGLAMVYGSLFDLIQHFVFTMPIIMNIFRILISNRMSQKCWVCLFNN